MFYLVAPQLHLYPTFFCMVLGVVILISFSTKPAGSPAARCASECAFHLAVLQLVMSDPHPLQISWTELLTSSYVTVSYTGSHSCV